MLEMPVLNTTAAIKEQQYVNEPWKLDKGYIISCYILSGFSVPVYLLTTTRTKHTRTGKTSEDVYKSTSVHWRGAIECVQRTA